MKRLFLSLFATLLMLLLAVLVLPFLIPVEDYKPTVLKLVKEQTGWDVTVTGEVSLALLPRIAVKMEGVTVANPPGYTSPYLAKLPALYAEMALMPLFSGHFEVDSIRLEQPEIWLEQTPNASNWQPRKLSPKTDSSPQKNKQNLDIHQIAIEDGTLRFRSPTQQIVARKVEAMWAGETLTLRSQLDVRGQAFAIIAALQQPFALLKGGSAPLALEVEHDSATLHFEGDVTPKQANGTLKIEAKTLAPFGLPNLPFALDSQSVSISPLAVMFSTLQMKLGSSMVEGRLQLQPLANGLKIAGNLASPRIALEEWQAQEATKDTADSHSAQSGWSTTPLPLTAIMGVLQGNLEVAIGALAEYENIKAVIGLKPQKITVSLSQCEWRGGVVTGTAAVEKGLTRPEVKAQLQFRRIPLTLERLTGNAQGEISLTAHGDSVNAWMQTLAGGGDVSLSEGVLKGYSLPELFRNLKKAKSDATPYTQAQLAFTVDNGIMQLQQGSFASPEFESQIAGRINLGARQLDLLLHPKIVPQFSDATQAAGTLFPLRVKGSFDDFTIQPDLKAAIGDALRDPLKAKQDFKTLKQEGKALFKAVKGIFKREQENTIGSASSGAGTGDQPDAGAGADTGGQDSGQPQPPAANQGGATGSP